MPTKYRPRNIVSSFTIMSSVRVSLPKNRQQNTQSQCFPTHACVGGETQSLGRSPVSVPLSLVLTGQYFLKERELTFMEQILDAYSTLWALY